jgi:hypothetical protein
MRRDLVLAAFCDYFGIGEARSALLIALFELRGDPATAKALGLRVDAHRPPGPGAIQEAISVLRKCMDSEAIDTSEAGYFLTEVGLGECGEALVAVAAALAAMGDTGRRALRVA